MDLKQKVTDGVPKVKTYWKTPMAGRYMTFKEIAAYAGGGIGAYFIISMGGALAVNINNMIVGGAIGGKGSSRTMMVSVCSAGIVFLLLGMFLPSEWTINVLEANVPVAIFFFVLCGLCTSVMWGGIFNLAVEGLGKYTEKGAGIFMAMVCGGGILPFVQNAVVDWTSNYLVSYWLIVAGLAYLLFYALAGAKNVNKDIPVE